MQCYKKISYGRCYAFVDGTLFLFFITTLSSWKLVEPDSAIHTWKDFFRSKHLQEDAYARLVPKAIRRYEREKNETNWKRVLSAMEQTKQADQLLAVSPQQRQHLMKELQYFIDTTLYSLVNITSEDEVTLEGYYNVHYTTYSNHIKGNMLSLKGESVPFLFQCDWMIHDRAEEYDDWGDNKISIGDLHNEVVYSDPSKRSHNTWLQNVRRLLGLSNAIDLDGLWTLIKTLMVPLFFKKCRKIYNPLYNEELEDSWRYAD